MRTATRVGAYVVGLGAVFGLALGVGALAGPVDEPARSDHPSEHTSEHDSGEYRLQLRNPGLAAGPARPLVFTITDADGTAVTRFDVSHTKRMHLVAVRHDFTGFRHVHPVMSPDGTWSTTLALTTGRWRVYADFVPWGGENTVVGDDLEVTGDPVSAVTPGVSREAVVDGYTVRLRGDLTAGAHSTLSFDVSRGNRRVTDLQPYLGAAGHLVALREDDHAYLHVHPDAQGLRFGVEVPAADRYHLYLDFKVGGVVRTAQFALDARTHGTGTSHGSEHSHD